MESRYKDYSANEDWDFFLNHKNIESSKQKLVFEKRKYFNVGEGKELFNALEFMNLFWKQSRFLYDNANRPFYALNTINALPLSTEQRKVLFDMILEFEEWSSKSSIHGQYEVALYILSKRISILLQHPAVQETWYKYTVADLEGMHANNDLDFYFNRLKSKIENTKLVFETFDYFETGIRKGFIEPSAFLNLLWKQYVFVSDNLSKPQSIITGLRALPIDDELRHVLFTFILKWYGTYPYPVGDGNARFNTAALKFIEEDFLNYSAETPELALYRATNQIHFEKSSNRNSYEEIQSVHNEDTIRKQKPHSSDLNITPGSSQFANFLNDRGKKSIDVILREYKGAKPEKITALLLALQQSGMSVKHLFGNKAALYRALEADSLINGTIQGLKQSILSFNKFNKEHLIEQAKTLLATI